MDDIISLPPPAVRAGYIAQGRLLHALAVRRAAADLGRSVARAGARLARMLRPAGAHRVPPQRPCPAP